MVIRGSFVEAAVGLATAFIGTGVDVFTTGTVKNVAGGGAYTMLMAT